MIKYFLVVLSFFIMRCGGNFFRTRLTQITKDDFDLLSPFEALKRAKIL